MVARFHGGAAAGGKGRDSSLPTLPSVVSISPRGGFLRVLVLPGRSPPPAEYNVIVSFFFLPALCRNDVYGDGFHARLDARQCVTFASHGPPCCRVSGKVCPRSALPLIPSDRRTPEPFTSLGLSEIILRYSLTLLPRKPSLDIVVLESFGYTMKQAQLIDLIFWKSRFKDEIRRNYARNCANEREEIREISELSISN